jgi:hypothetical protein
MNFTGMRTFPMIWYGRSFQIRRKSTIWSYRPSRRPSLCVDTVRDPLHLSGRSSQANAVRISAQGIHNVFYLLLPCCGVSFFVIIFFVKHHSLERSDDAALKQEGKDRIKQRKQKAEADTTGSGAGAGTEARDIK